MMSDTDRKTMDVCFTINGKEHKVSPKYSAVASLNDYLREVAGLKGTKVMCRQAGCGCCAVTVTHLRPNSDKLDTYSVQSCLTPLYSVDGWQISTIEGLGSQKNGFHPIQERIAQFNGSQCGYCTPGMVMNMYGLLHQKPDISAQEIEDSFDGNLCRCTGYRSILDAMKSFAKDGNISGSKAIDIEDLNKHLCPKTGEACSGDHCTEGGTRRLDIQISETKWLRPTTLDELGSLLRANKGKEMKLVFGNTASGIFQNEGPFEVYIDLHQVKYIYSYLVAEDNIRFGAATSLSNLLVRLKENQEKSGFKYFAAMHKHLKMVASVMVRNAGCIAGNLMIKHAHNDFPSDIFTMFEAVKAKLEIYDSATSKFIIYSLMDFLKKVNMTGKVITAVVLPKMEDSDVFRSFKITPRWQNAHAYVNAAFTFSVSNRIVKGKPSIVYGGINSETVHAVKTEEFLENKTLSGDVVKEALNILEGELKPEQDQILASPKYRQELALTLLYKVLLGVFKPDNPKLRSGTESLHRPISSGLQTYQEKKSEFPLKQPMPKKTANLQASGEAKFVNDLPTFQHELCAAFVQSDVGSATLESMDPSEALKMPGVVRFLSAEDIPEGGTNNCMVSSGSTKMETEEVFASKQISYSGQPIGAILAETQSQANAAARNVKVKYSNICKPILTIEESMERGKEFDLHRKEYACGSPDDAWNSVERKIEGECRSGTQYHFFIETHVSLAVPSEDGIDLHSATQYADLNQHACASVIGKPLNYISVTVPRLGGGFGGKSVDSTPAAVASTLGAYLTGRPVRMAMDLSSTMRLCGKRFPLLAKYKVGFSNSGDVQVIETDLYFDCGRNNNSSYIAGLVLYCIDQAYQVPNWKIHIHPMMTNKQTMSAVRAPIAIPAAFVIETIMEHVAKSLNKNPIVVKELNLYEQGQTDFMGHDLANCIIRNVWKSLKEKAEVEERMRQVDAFNEVNLWKKRGITMTASKYGIAFLAQGHGAHVAIFARDGTVAVSTGGVEMGQGVHTKVAQAVAHVFGIPIDNIKVRPNQNIITPNNLFSGAFIVSQLSTQAAIDACNILKERMQPVREKFPDLSWKELCAKCVDNKIDLSAKKICAPGLGKPFFNYFVYGAAVIETEVDILTGESQIRRVDIMSDLGESLNPTIDIGQIEGAFVFGLGCYLSEDVIYDSQTGQILNDGTWEYKPPTTKDIPIDWRVYLLPDSPNPTGIQSSKAVGEPPLALSVGALLANKLAVQSARKDLFGADDFIPAVAPYTVERAQQSVGLTVDSLIL